MRIGLVSFRNRIEESTIQTRPFDQLRAGLRKLGYIEGRNFVTEIRHAELDLQQLSEVYQDLVRARVDVLVASTSSSVIAAKRATSTIPIVMVAIVDPVGAGFVSSLARPGGNVTGLTIDAAPEATGKNLEFLKESVPGLHGVAVLWNPRFPGGLWPYWQAVEDAARRLGLDVQRVEAGTPKDLEPAFTAIARTQAKAVLLFGPTAAMFSGQRERTVSLAATHRLPTIYPGRAFVEAGGFMSYGPHPLWFWRKTALYLDKLFKGAKPADLLIEQPTKFELVINMKTAKALELTIPQSLLLRADEVIQ